MSPDALVNRLLETLVLAAVRHKRSGKVATGTSHPEAMENLLRTGLFPGVADLADLDELSIANLNKYNRIWGTVEIGFVDDRDQFVRREDGYDNVHGEDL